MRDYSQYQVWNEAVDFAVSVYQNTQKFPSEEKFGLVSQMRRAAVSIPSNIAEGSSRSSEKEFSRFLEFSLGSSFELKTQMIIANKLDLLEKGAFSNSILALDSIGKQLNGLRNSLK
ncbi:four helix bundle protein [Reichenbachiella agariperforans]|uniref:Four helix bundle protein n=1 Tax=Reichenbachiella agariperforans TaxID=156994 RepID=A0A1M6NVH3_REIAG|nr:four helix bundle protein [Reichenbachiella agariperforans]SHJ99696.1 four helix bundle protein [Reichenbachiella agariperforans]